MTSLIRVKLRRAAAHLLARSPALGHLVWTGLLLRTPTPLPLEDTNIPFNREQRWLPPIVRHRRQLAIRKPSHSRPYFRLCVVVGLARVSYVQDPDLHNSPPVPSAATQVDLAVIESVLEAHGGSEDRAVESLLAMTDESFKPEPRELASDTVRPPYASLIVLPGPRDDR